MMLIGASLLTGILGTLCPKKHQKHLRLLSGLCMIALLISPLPSYLEKADDLIGNLQENAKTDVENAYDEIYHQTLSEAHAKQVEEITKKHIIQTFSTNNEDISVSVEMTKDGEIVLLKKAMVAIGGSAIKIDPREIRNCVESFLNCPCEIVYR